MEDLDQPGGARDHLANERTFLAWVRTGVAMVVFGFAIGRFAIAIRQFFKPDERVPKTAGLSVWFGVLAIIAGAVLIFTGLSRYRQTRQQLEAGKFRPAGTVIDIVAVFTVAFGLALAGYLIYIQASMR
jgi:putative membrane protein